MDHEGGLFIVSQDSIQKEQAARILGYLQFQPETGTKYAQLLDSHLACLGN